MTRRGIIFIISSPSGGGKSTLLDMIMTRLDGLAESVSYTTRVPRRGERPGVDYRFIGEEEFQERVGRGFFAEWATVHGQSYGTSREDLRAIIDTGRDAVMDIDVQGARQLKAAFPDAVTIFILPPSLRDLENRLRKRGTEDASSIAVRLATAIDEMEALPFYDYVVLNRDLEKSARQLEAVIVAERQRTARIDAAGLLDGILGQRI